MSVAIIAPHISEHEEKVLKSQMALMKTREDVRAIDARMLPVMREHGIPIKGEASESSTNQQCRKFMSEELAEGL
jgi:protein-tyrosine-phosphatase